MSKKIKVLALVLLLSAGTLGVKAWESRLIARAEARGSGRVQAAWDAQELLRNQVTAGGNTLRQRNAEKTANAQTQREAVSQAAAASAATALRSLRAELARLQSRTNPYPAGDAGLTACAGEAATGRELFGESAQAYVELAAEADQLRDQIAGLQQFTASVCRAGKPLQPVTGATD